MIFDVLERGGELLFEPGQQKLISDVHHDIGVLIQELQQRLEAGESGVDINRLANVEMIYLDLLDGHPTTAKTLHGLLGQNPEFFSELIKALTPQKGPDGEKRELSERERLRAMNVYRLLNSWEQVPGSQADGSVDDVSLRNWLKSVRHRATSESHHTMTDLKIGAVLACAPKEGDGTWPCVPVRDAIEEFGTEALAEGFEVGIINRRGTYTKAIDEGGKQEREIAKEFRSWADASRSEWPKTAASLDRIADYYEAYSRREDAEAQERLKGL